MEMKMPELYQFGFWKGKTRSRPTPMLCLMFFYWQIYYKGNAHLYGKVNEKLQEFISAVYLYNNPPMISVKVEVNNFSLFFK
jgi:hypothetical protein